MPPTPTTPDGLRAYDALPAEQAVIRAWITPGPNSAHHVVMQQQVREAMPLLARALDRAAFHPTRRRQRAPHPPRTIQDPYTPQEREEDTTSAFRAILDDRVHQAAEATRRYTEARIRAALEEQGVNPAIVEDVARRAAAGEFDPPPPTVRITDT